MFKLSKKISICNVSEFKCSGFHHILLTGGVIPLINETQVVL